MIAKELLRISEDKVFVDYDFRNDADSPITTIVAFPVPAYTYEDDLDAYGRDGFDDFHLTADVTPRKFTVETRAFAGKKDVTAALSRLCIEAGSFGHMKDLEGFSNLHPLCDFALSTAKTWKTPIEDFTLIVKRPHNKVVEPYKTDLAS